MGTLGDTSHVINCLESERKTLLLKDEAIWRQRYKNSWLKSGDLNTKYFCHLAISSKSKKHIWKIFDAVGTLYEGQNSIKLAAVNFYKSFYEARPPVNLQTIVPVASLFPFSVSAEDFH